MSLVRIFCRSSERAAAFIAHLESLGYSVETIESGNPGACSTAVDGGSGFQAVPADVEIEIDECSLDEALARAEAFARGEPEAKIFVAPGVLSSPGIPVTAEPGDSPSFWSRLREKFWRPRRENEYGPELSLLGATDREEPLPTSAPDWVNQNPVAPITQDSARVPDPRRCCAGWEGIAPVPPAIEPDAAVQAEKLRQQRVEEEIRATALRRQAEERERQQAEERERAARIAQQAEAERQREERRLAFEAELARRNRQAQAEVLRMGTAAERIQPESEGWRESQSGNEPASEFVPNQPIAAPMSMPESELVAAVAAHPSVISERPAAIPVPPAGRVNTGEPKPRAARRRSLRIRDWQIAAAAGAAFGILLLGAWSLATSPSPASPLAPSRVLPGTMKQEVPFGPVTLTNPAPSNPVPTVTAPAKVKPAVPQAAPPKQGKPSALKPKRWVRRKRAGVAVRRAASVSNEVVVYHYTRAESDQRVQARAEPKTISDF